MPADAGMHGVTSREEWGPAWCQTTLLRDEDPRTGMLSAMVLVSAVSAQGLQLHDLRFVCSSTLLLWPMIFSLLDRNGLSPRTKGPIVDQSIAPWVQSKIRLWIDELCNLRQRVGCPDLKDR
jgi:hypothetical protein